MTTAILTPSDEATASGITATSVAEERRCNPRIADSVGEEDFVGYMRNLNLPHPKLLEVAVPANKSRKSRSDITRAMGFFVEELLITCAS